MSQYGPASWDAADWTAFRRQIDRGVLAHCANNYTKGAGAGEAQDITDAHDGLTALVKAAVAGSVTVDPAVVADAVAAAVGPALAAQVADTLAARLRS